MRSEKCARVCVYAGGRPFVGVLSPTKWLLAEVSLWCREILYSNGKTAELRINLILDAFSVWLALACAITTATAAASCNGRWWVCADELALTHYHISFAVFPFLFCIRTRFFPLTIIIIVKNYESLHLHSLFAFYSLNVSTNRPTLDRRIDRQSVWSRVFT